VKELTDLLQLFMVGAAVELLAVSIFLLLIREGPDMLESLMYLFQFNLLILKEL
jgi:hypothetical protein